ncbi:hypothetical protein [Amycolatopsis sp. H20-H5]|uniref:hypothetical protein n=1 Tax=Amycolatopsis sp. H20-H5 TaxID=3046309 RepID=UPI002DB6452E|nr:hypothetical protein [Amycolatopsis sp. H20-H5]MEC3976847.1 hypothetical protein [Amycolatopsis sp. H20-H5]
MTALRAGLVFLTAVQAGLGGWILVAPGSFFALPWVNMGLPYNEHLLLDFGAMNLALAVLLGVAAVRMDRVLVRTALVVYLVFAGAHVLIHTRYLGHLPPAQSAVLVTLLSLAAAVPIGLLVLTVRRSTTSAGTAPP